MSYNIELLVLKKKTFNEEVRLHKQLQMDYSYVDFAESCSYLLENEENDDSVSKEYGRFIINGNGSGYRIFQGFFKDVKNGTYTVVDKEQYIKLNEWFENKIKQLSLFDVLDPETAWEYLYSYNQVKYELDNIDFDNEFIVFWHSY